MHEHFTTARGCFGTVIAGAGTVVSFQAVDAWLRTGSAFVGFAAGVITICAGLPKAVRGVLEAIEIIKRKLK